jgi:hypothetical protein
MPANPLEKKISLGIENKLRTKLGIRRPQPLPPRLKTVVNSAAKDTYMAATQRYVRKEALSLAKQFYREPSVESALKGRLSSALKGVKLVSESADLQKMIDENAKMLFAKKQALENAGFSADQAFQLILTEVSAKKGK